MPQLATSNLTYQATGRSIINGIDWSLEKQEIVTITGPSGSGKSTFVRLLASLLEPTSGTITFDDQDIETLDPIAYRRRVSYAVQQPTLFGKTVRENLAFPYQLRKKPFDEQHAVKALQTVDLGASDLDREITSLSGGEKQRVALLRNVMFVPEVLIMDEVTTGLDSDSKGSVHKMIDYFNDRHQLSVIMITHDEEELKHAHNLYRLADGKLAEVDQHE
ncbi:ABC transporter ATP-binding protein [Fructilactobacillus florum]|nr:ATP-binding cassette domain-containing protein [Fructilactobacillus florum]